MSTVDFTKRNHLIAFRWIEDTEHLDAASRLAKCGGGLFLTYYWGCKIKTFHENMPNFISTGNMSWFWSPVNTDDVLHILTLYLMHFKATLQLWNSQFSFISQYDEYWSRWYQWWRQWFWSIPTLALYLMQRRRLLGVIMRINFIIMFTKNLNFPSAVKKSQH